MRRLVPHLAGWLLWLVALFVLWLLLVGEWNRIVIVGGLCAAAVAAALAETARASEGVDLRVPLRRVRAAWSVPALVFADFGLLVWALVRSALRRQVVRGRFVERPFRAETGVTTGDRAFTIMTATYSPNAYVVGIDPSRGVVLLHDLIEYRKSEEPA